MLISCNNCNILKNESAFHKDKYNKRGYKNICISCVQEKRKKFKDKIIIPNTIKCSICKNIKTSCMFDIDNTLIIGGKRTCKNCLSLHNKKYMNSSYEIQARKKIVSSWKAHKNPKQINKLSIDEGIKMLITQNYKCNHCKIKLEFKGSTTKKRNGNILSLDRINVDIQGYKNNSQWLCSSCNNGKNTMDNELHLNKFRFRDNLIMFLETENLQLRLMNKVQRLNGMGYESA